MYLNYCRNSTSTQHSVLHFTVMVVPAAGKYVAVVVGAGWRKWESSELVCINYSEKIVRAKSIAEIHCRSNWGHIVI